MDITYIPMARGFVYLSAVIDWFSRKVLAWRVSITMDTAFCVEAVEEALERYGVPYIFTGLLKEAGIRISMDGRGSWRDNLFIEHLWRSVKYEALS